MHTVTSFHASAVQPDELRGIMADYLALERAKTLRRLVVRCFGVLAVIVAVVSLMWLPAWLPALGFWSTIGLCAAMPVWAWTVELGCERRLARRLDEVPGHVHVVHPATSELGGRKKVIKSS